MVNKKTKQMIRAQRWVEEYGKWKASGLKQRAYCEKEGIGFWKFKAGGGRASRNDRTTEGRSV